MTNVPKEKSVEEIVEEFEKIFGERYREHTMFEQCNWLTQTLQAERQKRDEFDDDLFRKSAWYKAEKLMIVEEEREVTKGFIEQAKPFCQACIDHSDEDRLAGLHTKSCDFSRVLLHALTHPNNPE